MPASAGIFLALPLVMRLRHLPFLAALSLVCPTHASADQIDFRISDDLGTAEQNLPKVAIAPDGKFTVVWLDKRQGNADIFFQRFDTAGLPIGPNQKLNTDLQGSHQAEVSIANDLAGHLAAVWTDYREGSYPFTPDVFMQQLSSDGVPVGTNRKVTAELPDTLKANPDIALGPFGGVVVWADFRNQHWDIFLQRYDQSGTLQGNNVRVNDDPGLSQQYAPRVSIAPSGWFVVVWYDTRTGNDDIFGQLFDQAGNRRGANVRIHSDPTRARQAFPDVAADGAGHFTTVWVDWRNGTYPANPDIYARRFDTLWGPLGGEYRINTDANTAAQRDPSIAADRRGNAAVVWSDSSGSSFDISGQMVDVDGIVRVLNFRANTNADSTQIKPDVALDGRKRVTVWADRRNGNWDIYGAVTTYNTPRLTASPASVQFRQSAGGDAPEPIAVIIDHVGYNRLSFTVVETVDWLSVSPATSQTMDTIVLSITRADLDAGTYTTLLRCIDTDNADSSLTIPVTLQVIPPTLDADRDSLQFHLLASVVVADTAVVSIAPSAAGPFGWTASTNAAWLELVPMSGRDGDSVLVVAQALPGLVGNLEGLITITADSGVANSPLTIPIHCQIDSSGSFISLEPDTVFRASDDSSALLVSTVVVNRGTSPLQWSPGVLPTWLRRDSLAGGDSLKIRASMAGQPFGRYQATITVLDTASFNGADSIILGFVYAAPPIDTLRVAPTVLPARSTGIVPVFLSGPTIFRQIRMPVAADGDAFALSSCRLQSNDPHAMVQIELVGTSGWNLVATGDSLTLLHPGEPLLLLEGTSGEEGSAAIIGRPIDIGYPAYGLMLDSVPRLLTVLADSLLISVSTDVEIDTSDVPDGFALAQNYPNPCNPRTSISFSLPTAARVQLTLYNLLGQQVRLLADQLLPAGTHSVEWDGMNDLQRPAATGVYFYRLEAADFQQSKKLILLK